jgi:hypothetical protein
MRSGNIQPSLDIEEHIDENWGFQGGKAVYVVDGVPVGGYKSNPTISLTYTSTASFGQRLTQIDKLILSGATICRFRQTLEYIDSGAGEGEIGNISTWRLI